MADRSLMLISSSLILILSEGASKRALGSSDPRLFGTILSKASVDELYPPLCRSRSRFTSDTGYELFPDGVTAPAPVENLCSFLFDCSFSLCSWSGTSRESMEFDFRRCCYDTS